jgi:hypothetical protein
MKKFFYVTSFPKTGQTVLASLLHQNSNICFTPDSPVLACMNGLAYFKTYDRIYNNFKNPVAFDKAVHAFRNKYYEEFTDSKYILERGPWATSKNRDILASFEEKPKFIIIYRPILEALASLIKSEKPNLDLPILTRCQHLLAPDGAFGKGFTSIKGALKEDHIIIHYKDIVSKPKETVKKIYDYIGLDFKGVRTTDLDQYEVKGIKYNDVLLDGIPHQNLHTIRTDKIKENKINVKDYLPQNIINMYKDADFL